MSLPKEPRQLMINLMYLVLTALLAMNVSSEILNAFKIVDNSLSQSSKSIDEKNRVTKEDYDKLFENDEIKKNPEKVKKLTDYKPLIEKASQLSKEMTAKLDTYKEMIIKRAGGINPQTKLLDRPEDLDAATAVMIEHDKKGKEMKDALEKYIQELAALIPTDGDKLESIKPRNEAIEKTFPFSFEVIASEDNTTKDWSYGNFHMVPAIGAVTIMDKYINDVKTSESMVIDNLWGLATGEKRNKIIPLNDFELMVSSPNSYLLPGEKYTAQVMLGAYNKSASTLSVRINGANVAVKDGMATYSTVASGKGEQKVTVSASFIDPNNNQTRTFTKTATYFIGEAQASISLDKMNVFYIGVDNPITFSASGIPAGNLTFSAEGCTLTKAEGVNKYMVRPTGAQGTKAKITLSGKMGDGTTKAFGTYEYRVKKIPDPYPVIANSRGGSICAGAVSVQQAIFARLDNFDFDVKFDVVSYDVLYAPKRKEAIEASSRNMFLNGPNGSPQIKDMLNSLKPGDRIYFENIKAKGPDGSIRSIGSVNFIINC